MCISPKTRTEALGEMENAKASSSTSLINKSKPSKSKNKLARKRKAARKLVKKFPKTAGRKKRGFTGV